MIRVRPASLEDLRAIQAVSVRNGLSGFDSEERKGWWLSHPFQEHFEEVPIGWVLEKDDGEIVGTFSNIHMMYEMEGKRLRCAVAGSWGVDAQYRNSSLLLAMSYLRQTGVDFCLSGSASSVGSRLMTTLKVQRIPSEDYDLSYFWITNHAAFAESVLRKKRIPYPELLSRPVGFGLKVADLCIGRSRSGAILKRFDTFGSEFDELWDELRRGRRWLTAVRSSAALEWRFGSALRQGRALVLGLLQGEKLCGYVVLSQKDRANLRLRHFVIADLQALNDSPEVILDLLSGAIHATCERGLDALEWQGWNCIKRRVALKLKPKSYRYPVWPLYYKTTLPDLIAPLAQAETWDFSPFDAF